MRVDGWLNAYHQLFDDIRNVPFSWSERHDCLFGLVVPVVKALTGEDHFKRYARYKTASGALKVLRGSGFANLGDLVASELQEVHKSACVIGDVVAIPTNDDFGFALGISDNDHVFVLGETCLGVRSMNDATRAFKV